MKLFLGELMLYYSDYKPYCLYKYVLTMYVVKKREGDSFNIQYKL